MKSLAQLLDTDQPAWQELILPSLADATNHYECLPRCPDFAEKELFALQISIRSTLGAVVWQTGGLLIHHGWLRLLGSGSDKLIGIMANHADVQHSNDDKSVGYLVVAYDVLGGIFAMNGGGIAGELGTIHYFAPDTLEWESLGLGYTDFFHWTLNGDIAQFYQGFFWENWQTEIAQLAANEVMYCMPPLWSAEGKDIEQSVRKPVSFSEFYHLVI